MFKIVVDGVEHGRYDEKEWVWIDVGGGTDDEVLVPWATETLLSIYPMSYGDFLVEIHGDNSIVVPKLLTEGVVTRVRDPNCAAGGQVYVRSGSTMTIMGHTIQAINIPIPNPYGKGRRCCGREYWECTCGTS
jgi:hypothetical protein